MEYPKPCSQVKVETNTGHGEAQSSSKKWYILIEDNRVFIIEVACISLSNLREVRVNEIIHTYILYAAHTIRRKDY